MAQRTWFHALRVETAPGLRGAEVQCIFTHRPNGRERNEPGNVPRPLPPKGLQVQQQTAEQETLLQVVVLVHI